MPLQNRVTPFGEIVALEGRGLLTGNRGILHDDDRRIVRPFQVRRWITCRLEYRGIRRTLMRPHSWTELFFLDEATSLGAGHRPCAECRREDYQRFRRLWEEHHTALTSADLIDVALHANRIAHRKKLTYAEDVRTVPDGIFVVIDGCAWLVWNAELLEWSDAGYVHRLPRPIRGEFEVLTPRPTVDILRAGYVAAVHPSALS
ncbi:MAG: hypothetical protein JO092_10485 [Candidatus Eremiobacteraeota bacterium]|nr:hypothetical protein [Candidatus Eremiobacteraeota bacterium]